MLGDDYRDKVVVAELAKHCFSPYFPKVFAFSADFGGNYGTTADFQE